jgi:hypothetical protein
VVEHLGDAAGVLVVDETGFVKKATKSAGVQRQDTGTVGKKENCQVGVFLAYASGRGAALVDRELYLPESWTTDRARCRRAAVPDQVGFQTKPQLARMMLERTLDAGIPVAWVTGDEAYGSDARLRLWLEARQVPHVLAVKRTRHVIAMNLVPTPAQDLIAAVDRDAWQTLSAGDGAKARGSTTGRRSRSGRCASPARAIGCSHDAAWTTARSSPTTAATARPVPPLPNWSASPGPAGRWRAAFNRPRGRPGWITMRSAATTPGIATSPWRWWRTRSWWSCGPGLGPQGAGERAEVADPRAGSSVPEIRRLLGLLVWPATTDPVLVLGWSWWRRRHQARARRCHWRNRTQKVQL